MKVVTRALNWLANTTGVRVLPARLPHPRDPNVETLKVPGYYQTQGHTCGFAAGLMILRYFRPDLPVARFYASVRPHARSGVSRSRLMNTLRLHGLRVRWRTDLDFNGIVDAIDAGKPIAVVVNTNKDNVGHWVVIYGYGRKPNRVWVAGELMFRTQHVYPFGFFARHFWANPGFGLVCAASR